VGGVIFFTMGWDMLQARLGNFKHTEDEDKIDAYVEDISITPLAIPMICGPGAITNAIILMEDAKEVPLKIVLIATVAFILLLTYLILVGASKITEKMGKTGNKVMMRLMGLIVMVIAVEFFFSGLKPIILDILNS
jgi:multiple antibiotic resistance protein